MALRWNYSLRTLLLAAFAICVAVAYYSTLRQLRQAAQELRVLRDETGHLSVDDKSKVHAIAVERDEPNTWRWRLFVPKGHRYKWNLACEEIPYDTVASKPGTIGVFSNEPYWEQDNEILVTAKLRQTSDDEWLLSVDSRIGGAKSQMYGASLKILAEKLRWMSEITSTDGQILGDRGTAIRDPQGPIILLQRRPCERQPDGTYRPSPHPMPGLMIWLEEI